VIHQWCMYCRGGIFVTAEKTILRPHKKSHGWWRWQCFRLQPSAYCVSLQLISTCPKWFLPVMVVTMSLCEQNGQTSGSQEVQQPDINGKEHSQLSHILSESN
jgi:hypothetical protein